MGDIQSKEGRDIMLELELPAMATECECDSAREVTIATAELTYFNIITSKLEIAKCELKICYAGNVAEIFLKNVVKYFIPLFTMLYSFKSHFCFK